MAKKIALIFLFLSLIAYITAETIWIDYDYSTQSAEYKHDKKSKIKTITPEFKQTYPYYVKVVVTPEEGSPTPLLCFSPTDANCKIDRQAFAKNTEGKPAFFFVKREQFQPSGKELYINVECQDNNCGYNLKVTGAQTAEIDVNSVYSFYASDDTREMRFDVIGEAKEGSFLIIGFEGSSKATLDVEDVSSDYIIDLGNGKIVTVPLVPEENSAVLKSFSVKNPTKGDYITLNVHTVNDNKAEDNFLYPNGPAVMGVLDKKEGYFREECFPVSLFVSEKYKYISNFYLTGTIYSKYGLFWLADENNMYMEETEQEIFDGHLSHLIETNGKMRSICFEFSYLEEVTMDYVVYSISILEPTSLDKLYNFYPPQTIGQTYRRMIPKGGYAVFHGGKIESGDKRYNFNVYVRKGVAEMYVDKCTTLPNCDYKDKLDGLTKVKRVGKQAIWETTVDKSGVSDALASEKYVMVVHCKDEDNNSKGFCEVDTSIFVPGKDINLVENEKFSKFALKGERGSFMADLKSGIKVQRATVDIMVFSGDVSFEAKMKSPNKNSKLGEEFIDINYYKYYLSNKVFFHFNFAQLALDIIEIEYVASANSFFTIQFGMNSMNLIQTEEIVPSGESYLVEIDPTTIERIKTVYLLNHRTKAKKPFLANFFALNCDFQVWRDKSEIPFFDGYAQEVLKEDDNGYTDEKYAYHIMISEQDLSNYNHKMCMLYVAGYESKDDTYETEIVVAENVNQQVIFDDDFRTVRFLFPHADPEKDLAINFNVIDQAYYNIKVYLNSETKVFKEYTLTRDEINYIPGNNLTTHCERNTLCNVIVEVTYDKPLENMVKTDPMIEVTIRQIQNYPTYIQKSQAKKDFTCGDRFYYLYTDVGKNEVGEVLVNFLRDFGNVWGKIVRKDQTSVDQEANWRGIYRMPSEEWEDSLPYNGYTKKFEIGVEDTQDCIEGCYLLLSIRVSQIGDYVNDYKFYPFTIITRINPNNHAYTDIPKVVIQTEEYIVGNVDLSQNERIYQFYEVWLPHDSIQVEIDWQSSVAGLFINVGGTRPTTKNADFKLLPPGTDTIFTLAKLDILDKAKVRKVRPPYANSIQDLSLTIGVWTDKMDSLDTELFSLRVHIPNDDFELDIIEINTDQKFLCTPQFVNDEVYRCLFMVTYDDEDVSLGLPLIVHANSMNQTAATVTLASFIERKYFDEYNFDYLKTNTPTEQTAQYSTIKSNINYIYTDLSGKSTDKKYYLFVNVITDYGNPVMIITSMPMFNVIDPTNYEFYPNPSSEQLLALSVESLKLKFFTSSSLIVNIECLGGGADIRWADDASIVYKLRGNGDRLALTSGEKVDELVITNVKKEKPGFVFYISYYVRNADNNFDEVKYGQSIEIGYRKTDLPVYLYSKVGAYFTDLNVAVTFRDSDIDTEGEYRYSPFIVKASLVRESTIYKAKKNPELTPTLSKSLFGNYDLALKTAQVFLSHEIIKQFNVKPEENPTVYLSLEKEKLYEQKIYSKFNLEAQFSKVNDETTPVENTYNYGKYTGYYTNYYTLIADKSKPIMIIELAFNSDYMNFAINSIMSRNNDTSLVEQIVKARGKLIIYLKSNLNIPYIFLNLLKKNYRQYNDLDLNNYAFKYVNVEKKEDYIDFKMLKDNNEIEYKETNENNETVIECTFNKIDVEKDKANITYFFKIVENSTLNYGENCETIAVMVSPYYAVYERNPKDINGKITLVAKGNLENWACLQVIAQIQQNTVLEYVAYKSVRLIRPPIEESGKRRSDSSGASTAFFIIAIILIVVIVGLVAVVFIFQQRNKSLLNQVKHVSFQQNPNNNADPSLLLHKNQA